MMPTVIEDGDWFYIVNSKGQRVPGSFLSRVSAEKYLEDYGWKVEEDVDMIIVPRKVVASSQVGNAKKSLVGKGFVQQKLF